MLRYLIILFFCYISIASYGQVEKTKPAAVLFYVSKTPTYTDEFIYLYKKNHQNKPEDFTDPKINEYLTLFINFKLKVTEARALGMDTTSKFNKEYKTYREDLLKPYRAEPDALDKLTKEAYAHLQQEVKASHILINLKADPLPSDTLEAYAKIDIIKKRIMAGEDFEKLARELSEDPSAKYNGGDLGYFTAMQMVYPFEEAAYKTEIGKLSKIVRTRFGYHLIKVLDKKPARGEVEVSHILLRTGRENDTKTKNKIFEIYDQLKGGRSWDELCKENSEDANTKDLGGKLRAFGIGALASVPEFENTAFALKNPGDLSDPFQSSIGWHLIRMEKKIPLPSYAELEASLKRKVARDERLQISQQASTVKRRKEFGFNENKEAKQAILLLADSTLLKGKWKYTGPAELSGRKLFSILNKEIKVSAFIQYINLNQSIATIAPAAYMDQLYNFFIDETITLSEEAKLIAEKPEFKNLLTEYREGILFFEIMEKKIWNEASEDTTGQRKYYQANQANYKAGDRVEAQIFATPDKSIIEGFKKKIASGDTLKQTDLKKFKSVQPFRKYEKGESKIMDKISWTTGLHELELDKTFYLIEVSRLVAPGLKSFEEARASIISDYQTELEKKWLDALRIKYPVILDKKGKQMVFSTLLKK